MADPARAEKFFIGNAHRDIRFSIRAIRIIEKKFRPMSLLQVLRALASEDGGVNVDMLCEATAAGMIDGRPVTADNVAAWLEADQQLVGPLATAVVRAMSASFQRQVPNSDKGEAKPGEASTTAATAPTSTTEAGPSLEESPG